ncbi:M20/M25/M40 family metallo-hydrolase [Candidatus Woesebacteria bacterium]|nr:M20/M25/M40 family metallo-hydrolase [Candidatus Woesebacteria bacterium]
MDVVSTFKELVAIDSPSGSEEKMRNWLISWATKRKLAVVVDAVGNLIIKKSAKQMTPFFLCAHMDTVEPGRNIKPQIKNRLICSDGTTILGADNKAALAAILAASDEWIRTSNLGIELVFTVKEETGGGAEFFDRSVLLNQIGFIFDHAAPLGGIIMSAPFITNFKVEFLGKAAHSCFPKKGRNPVHFAADFMKSLQYGETNEKQTFVNIGIISGGSVVNAVPEKIVLEGEVRSFSENHFLERLHLIETNVITIGKKYPEIKHSFEKSGYCPGYQHHPASSQVKYIKKIFTTLHLKPTMHTTFGISDANSLCSMGLQVISLSDGVVDPHTTKERVAISDLEKMKEIILLMFATPLSKVAA